MGRPSSRDRVLDALERMLVRDGTQAITLDAVCAEAGISKGGLLYHFDSRDALFAGLFDRLRTSLEEFLVDAPHQPRDLVAWYLDHAVPSEQDQALYRALLATARAEVGGGDRAERHADDVAELFDQFFAPLARIGDPTLASHVRLVADGLFFNAMLGLAPPAADALAAIRAGLLADL